MRALLTPKQSRKKSISQLKDEARAVLNGALPATQVAISDPPTIEGLGDWFPIMVRVVGSDLAEVNRQARFVAEFLKKNPGTADVRIEANPPKPELTIDIDRVRASDLGLSAAQIATQ